MIANYTDVATIAGRLGHKDATTTLTVYAHQFQSRDAKAADMFGDFAKNALGELDKNGHSASA